MDSAVEQAQDVLKVDAKFVLFSMFLCNKVRTCALKRRSLVRVRQYTQLRGCPFGHFVFVTTG